MTVRTQPLGVCTSVLLANPFACTPDDLHAVVAAAGLAGFKQASLWTMHYQMAKAAGMIDAQLVEWIAAAGIDIVLVEAAASWSTNDSTAIDTEVSSVTDLCRLVGASRVLAVTLDPAPLDRPAATAGLARMAAGFARAGIRPAVEFLPWTAIPTLEAAWSLIEASGATNVDLVLDTWHWLRQPGGPQLDVLARIPGERIAVLQLGDAPAEPDTDDLMDETMNRRLLPGEGACDLDALVAVLDRIGAAPIIAPEPFNPARAAAGPTVYAHAIANATKTALGV